jgi:hypothetical protein
MNLNKGERRKYLICFSSNKFRFILVEWITDGFTQIHMVDIQIKPTLLGATYSPEKSTDLSRGRVKLF